MKDEIRVRCAWKQTTKEEIEDRNGDDLNCDDQGLLMKFDRPTR